jgi:starch synthase
LTTFQLVIRIPKIHEVVKIPKKSLSKPDAGAKKKLTVILATSEAAPYAKTGGLADVSGSLARALAGLGVEVHLFMPLYAVVDRKSAGIGKKKPARITIPISARRPEGYVHTAKVSENFSAHFIEHEGYFGREHLYNTPSGDYADNCERFVFFCRGVLEGTKVLGIKPDIIHANDWQASLLPVYLKTVFKDDPYFAKTASALTIHNLSFQGHFAQRDWHLTGLPWDIFASGRMEFYKMVNFLKGGILFSDVITTVSQSYASEIKTPEFGWGLEGVLRERSASLHGVLNGIDTDVWNPAADKLIPASYTPKKLAGKAVCKSRLLEELGLPQGAEPLLGIVTRLTDQKGMGLLAETLDRILDNNVKLAVLGSGAPNHEAYFNALAARRPDRVAVRIGYDEGLAHRIEAGSDIFLMPSLYEPCGLNQMYSLRYGTPPVVRATGGLNDTVDDYNPATGEGNGFKFTEPTPHAFFWKTAEALNILRNRPREWSRIVHNGMIGDYSWDRSARSYIRIYKSALAARK